jgi:translation elongation factor EF-G
MPVVLDKTNNHRNVEAQMSEMKIVFMEGCFDDFEGTQEELNELIADLNKQLQDGTLLLNSEPLSEEDERALIEKMRYKSLGSKH